MGYSHRPGLQEFMNENAQYQEAVEKINQKLALKEAINRANEAISMSKKTSQIGGEDIRS